MKDFKSYQKLELPASRLLLMWEICLLRARRVCKVIIIDS